jgi:hypothetical protein
LIAAASESVPFLKGRLHLVPVTVAQRIPQLIKQLDSDQFAERQRATSELEQYQELAEPALRKLLTLQPTLEVRRRVEALLAKWNGRLTTPDLLRGVRAIEVLEHIDTAAARQVLETLATGVPEARLTQEAKASLQRLARRLAP